MRILLLLVLFCNSILFSQELELINISSEENVDCKKRIKIQAINRDRQVSRVEIQVQPIPDNLNKPNPKIYRAVKVGNNPDGSETYILNLDIEDWQWFDYDVLAIGKRRGIGTYIPKWTKKLNFKKCNPSGFKRAVIVKRGSSLADAQLSQCLVSASELDRNQSVFLNTNTELVEGKLFKLSLGTVTSYYELLFNNGIANSSSFASFVTTSSVDGPFDENCDDSDDNGGGDGASGYNLQLLESNVFVYSSCNICPSQLSELNPEFAGGTFPIYKHLMTLEGNTVQTQFTIKNIGNNISEATKINFYLSTGYNSIQGVLAADKEIELPSLVSGGEFLANPTFTISDFNRASGNYYLVIDVEPAGNDSDLTNNFVSIPMEVRSINGAPRPTIIQTPGNNVNNSESYELKVYNFSGILQSAHIVEDYSKELEIINNLPRGMYIVRKGDTMYKVSR